jgi:hypothetical protein
MAAAIAAAFLISILLFDCEGEQPLERGSGLCGCQWQSIRSVHRRHRHRWLLTAAYSRSSADVATFGTPLWQEIQPSRGVDNGFTHSFALSGYWQPFRSGWLPSISAGWGLNRGIYTDRSTRVPSDEQGYRVGSESWYVGLVWADVIAKGNALGFAFGQPMKTTNTDGDTVCQVWFPPQACRGGRKINADANFHKVNDRNLAFEAYYKIQVSDHLTVTPALFWLARPLGQYTLNSGPGTNNKGTLNALGYLLQTTFRF